MRWMKNIHNCLFNIPGTWLATPVFPLDVPVLAFSPARCCALRVLRKNSRGKNMHSGECFTHAHTALTTVDITRPTLTWQSRWSPRGSCSCKKVGHRRRREGYLCTSVLFLVCVSWRFSRFLPANEDIDSSLRNTIQVYTFSVLFCIFPPDI